ncbi:DUF4169 family protein [Novosphingobium sp. AAP93]|uniref:DUF4169 family protein n=1 Tax=Novosphingobium sp. AAP93 TaxID=1523427 RepID=UPI0006B90A73|nr:DUF4169 family protein [Novosphingobium sp. AAP93]KPF79540.1 hypothetical protein IP83_16295 [Novosphingobium sp. AAP93]
MGEVVNLRLARKAAARKGKEAQAAANRAAHGRTRAERAASKAEAERTARLLDGAKREGRD